MCEMIWATKYQSYDLCEIIIIEFCFMLENSSTMMMESWVEVFNFGRSKLKI